MKLAGEMTLSRVTSNTEDDYITLTVVDRASRSHFFKARLSLEGFARMLTGRGNVEVDLEVFTAKLGMRREHKTVFLPVPTDYLQGEAWEVFYLPLLEKIEVDGWSARQEDIDNNNKRKLSKDGMWRVEVVCERWVPSEEETA